MAGDKTVSGHHHFKLDLGGFEGGLLFNSVSMPSGTLDIPDFKTWDANGNPVNSVGGGTQVNWSDIQLTRGVDTDKQLYTWFKDVRKSGVTTDTKKDIKLTVLDSEGKDLHVWNVTGAVINSYGMAGADAQTMAVLIESVSIKFEDAKLDE